MFCNLTANAVRGAPLNLAKTADLEQDIAEVNVESVSRTQQAIAGHLSGGKQVINRGQESMRMIWKPSEILRSYF